MGLTDDSQPRAFRPPSSAIGRARRSVVHEASRILRRTAFLFGGDFRELRLSAHVTQADVGRAIRVDRSRISRMERGDIEVSDRVRARAAAALGAELRLAIFPSGEPLIYDAAHARMVEAIVAAAGPSWTTTLELPVPGQGRRSVDVALRGPDDL